MSAYDAVERWVYSGGVALAPRTFRQGKSDRQLAAQLIADWSTWSEGECPHSLAELESAFAVVRAETMHRR